MNKKYLFLIPLLLACFIHLVNPVGFPEIFFDEGIYMRRAMNMMDTGNPQESYLYDHPYFGQIILASVLHITNYPPDPISSDPSSLQSLYLIPRVFMGLIAILSTFLVYQIAKEKFSQNVALLSSTLFAVMPYTWIFDRILLDSILFTILADIYPVCNSFYKTSKQYVVRTSFWNHVGSCNIYKSSCLCFYSIYNLANFSKTKKVS